MALDEFAWLRSLIEYDESDSTWIDTTVRRLEEQYAAEDTVDKLLRAAVDDAEPINTEASTALWTLERRIAAEKRPRTWLWGVATAAAVMIVLVGAVMILRPSPVSALTNIAEATEVLPNDAYLGDGVIRESDELVLVISDISDASGVSYLQPLHRIRRVTTDVEQVEIINGDPIFFTPGDEARYGAQIRAEGSPGVSQTLTTTRPEPDRFDSLLASDPDVLAAALREYVSSYGDPAVSDDVEILELIAEIYRTDLPQPKGRGALIRVAASIEAAKPIEVALPDVTAIRIEHTGRGLREAYTIGFNKTGWMVYDETLLLEAVPDIGVPQDTPLSRSTYAVPLGK